MNIKSSLYILIITIFFSNKIFGQLSQKLVGSPTHSEIALSTKIIPNNGVIVAGYKFLPAGSSDCMIYRMDNAGNVLWERIFSTTNIDRFINVISTYDGGFVAVGYINATSAYVNNTAIIVKFDALGNTVWSKTFKNTVAGETFLDVVEMPITHNIVAVGAANFAPGSADTWVVNFSPIGTVNWQKKFSIGSTDYALAVSALNNKILIGGTFIGASYTDLGIIAVNDVSGIVDWSKSYDVYSNAYSGSSNGLLNIEVSGNNIYLNTQIAESYLPSVFITQCIVAIDSNGNNPKAFEISRPGNPFCIWSRLEVLDQNNIYVVQTNSNIYFNPLINNTGANYTANTTILNLKNLVPNQNPIKKSKNLPVNGNTSYFGLDVDYNSFVSCGYTNNSTNQIGNLDVNIFKSDTSLGFINACNIVDVPMNIHYPTVSSNNYSVQVSNTSVPQNNVFSTTSLIDSTVLICGIDTSLNPIVNINADFTYNDTCSYSVYFVDSSYGSSMATSFFWDFGDLLSGATSTAIINNPVHTFSSAGVFNVKLVVGNSIGITDTIVKTIVLDTLPYIQIPQTTIPICSSGSTTINITSNATTYTWTPSLGLSNSTILNPIATPTITTSYTLSVSDIKGCITSEVITVQITPTPIVNAGNDTTYCNNNTSIQLNGTGQGTPLWSPTTALSNPNILNPIATPTSITNYTLTVTNAAGCSATDVVTLTPLTTPTLSVGNNFTICTNSILPANISASTNANTFTWSPTTNLLNPTSLTPVASPMITTIYTITANNANGCSTSNSISVLVNNSPIVNAGNDTTYCNNNTSVQLNGSGQGNAIWTPATGLSNPNILNPITSPSTVTNYTLSITNAAGCSATDVVTVSPLTTPTLSVSNNFTICTNSILPANISASTNANTFTWSPATNLLNPTSLTPVASPMITTIYTITANNANGCSTSNSISVLVNNSPIVNAGNDTTYCNNNTSVQLNGSGQGNAIWTPATGLSNPNILNPITSPSTVTNYTLSITNAAGCSATDVVTVSPLTTPTLSVSNNFTICTNAILPVNLSASTNANSFVWSPTTNLVNPATLTPIASPTISTVYTITASNNNGCSTTSAISVAVNNPPVVNAGNDFTFCTDTSGVILNASGLGNAVWIPTNGLNNSNILNPIANPSQTTTYTLTVTSPNGCSATDAVTITPMPAPIISVSGKDSICPLDSTLLTATGSVSYLWQPSNTSTNQYWATPLGSTIYTITGTGSNGCINTVTKSIYILPYANISLVYDSVICLGSTATITAYGATNFTWQTGNAPILSLSNNEFITNPTTDFSFTVTGTGPNICENSISRNITIDKKPEITLVKSNDINCTYKSVYLSAQGANSYSWLPNQYLDLNIGNSVVANPPVTTTYTVTGLSIACSTVDTITVNVLDDNHDKISFPNAFTPNNSQLNEEFRIIGETNFRSYHLQIFNRFGQKVFESRDINKNWDGEHKNFPANEDTYFYLFKGTTGCGDIILKGDINLLR